MAIKDVVIAAVNNPKVLVTAGIFGFIGAAAWACVQTLKLEDIVDDQNAKIDFITENHSEEELKLPEVKKEVTVVRAKTIGKIALNYAGPVAVAGIAAYAICRAYGLQKQAYLAMSAAYGSMAKAYDTVLERVERKWGEEGLKYAKYGIEQREVENEVVDEKGKTKKVKEKEDFVNEHEDDRWAELKAANPLAMVFDEDTALYKSNGGNLETMIKEIYACQNGLNRIYNTGCLINFNMHVVGGLCGNDPDFMTDLGSIFGWYACDPVNKEHTNGCVDLRPYTFTGTDPYTGEAKQYVAIDPNAYIVDIDKNRKYWPQGQLQLDKKRVGKKYLSQVSA